MNKINWSVVAVIGIFVLLILLFSTGLFGGWGMMGPGMMGGWGYSPFGWIGMIFMWLVPVGFIVLTAMGVAWLVRAIGGVTPPPSGRACPNCARGGVQPEWQNCPYCGTALK